MAKPLRVVLEAYGELSAKDIVDGLVDFYNLVFYFKEFALVSTRAILPLCTRAHMQALMTRVGGDNLTIVGIFQGTYYGPTPRMFTHIFALQGPKDMFMPISPIYALLEKFIVFSALCFCFSCCLLLL